jgi:hypothetical protein
MAGRWFHILFFLDEKTRYIFLQRTFKGRLLAAAPVFTYRLGYMAGLTNMPLG